MAWRHFSLLVIASVLSKLKQAIQSMQPFTPSNKIHFKKINWSKNQLNFINLYKEFSHYRII